MCRFGTAALLCATAVVGPLLAQDNVSTRTKTLLAAEWKETGNDGLSGIMRCLTALKEYTAHGAEADPRDALNQLRSGIDQIPSILTAPLSTIAGPAPFNGAHNLYIRAHDEGRMPEFLASATQQSVDNMNGHAKAAQFAAALTILKDKYGLTPDSLNERVNKVYDKDPLRALYNLLRDLYPVFTDQASADIAAAKMETYRTCYLIDKNKLFGLVTTFLQ
jgi:hypothetical protein